MDRFKKVLNEILFACSDNLNTFYAYFNIWLKENINFYRINYNICHTSLDF